MLLLLPVLTVILTACGAHPDPQTATSGHPPKIDGRLVGVGGPSGSPARHWQGTVTLTAEDGTVTTVHTDAHGRFSVPAPSGPGHYTLAGTSPLYGPGVCRGPGAVTVHGHRTTHVDVVCQLR